MLYLRTYNATITQGQLMMEWALLWSIFSWLVPAKRLFSALLMRKQERRMKALAKKDPAKSAREAFALLSEELRLAVRRATLQNPRGPYWDPETLRRARLIDSETEEAVRRLDSTIRCTSERDAIEYWHKIKDLLRQIKKIRRAPPV